MRSLPARRTWWAIGALVLGGLWLLFVGCLFVTGYWATVTVTGGAGDGFCDVVREDPSGRRLSGESDCYDEPVGSRFEARVSGWPDAGEPTLTETYVGLGLMPDEDPADPPCDRDVWWVCDGAGAVLSADRGGPLVLARRR